MAEKDDITHINVSSTNQIGGITAGVFNVYQKPQRSLDENFKAKLLSFLPSKNAKVHVSVNGMENEGRIFGASIHAFLTSQGYADVQGVHTILGFAPFEGTRVEKKAENEFVVFIGHN